MVKVLSKSILPLVESAVIKDAAVSMVPLRIEPMPEAAFKSIVPEVISMSASAVAFSSILAADVIVIKSPAAVMLST